MTIATNQSVKCAEDEIVSVDLVRAVRRSDDYSSMLTDVELAAADERYRKFLLLAARHPGRALAPTRDIDLMWHVHMLHPRAYFEDCMHLFGCILDHDGGFGHDVCEAPILTQVFAETAALWRETYSEPYTGDVNCWHRCKSYCKRACKSASGLEVSHVSR